MCCYLNKLFFPFHHLLLPVYEARHLAGFLRSEGQGSDAAVFPFHINRDAATGTDARNGAILPVVGEGRKKFYGNLGLHHEAVLRLCKFEAKLTLHQHLNHTSTTAEVAVDLEG